MVFHRSLTIFRPDWRGRRARRAAAERKGAEVGVGSCAGCVLPARSPPWGPAPGPAGHGRACAGGCPPVCARRARVRAGAREPPASRSRRPLPAPRALPPSRPPGLFCLGLSPLLLLPPASRGHAHASSPSPERPRQRGRPAPARAPPGGRQTAAGSPAPAVSRRRPKAPATPPRKLPPGPESRQLTGRGGRRAGPAPRAPPPAVGRLLGARPRSPQAPQLWVEVGARRTTPLAGFWGPGLAPGPARPVPESPAPRDLPL